MSVPKRLTQGCSKWNNPSLTIQYGQGEEPSVNKF